jgi:hypothetical protein
MERKANTYLLRDDVFLRLICPNPVISPNEGARISHSAVSENVNRRPNLTPRIASVDNVTEGSGRSCRRLGSRR